MTALGIAAVTLSVLLLSMAGIHAHMSFTVTQRQREIGIRTPHAPHPAERLHPGGGAARDSVNHSAQIAARRPPRRDAGMGRSETLSRLLS